MLPNVIRRLLQCRSKRDTGYQALRVRFCQRCGRMRGTLLLGEASALAVMRL